MNDILDENIEREEPQTIPNLLVSTVLLSLCGVGFLFKLMHLKYAYILLVTGLCLGLSYQIGCFIILKGKSTANNWLLGINAFLAIGITLIGGQFTSMFIGLWLYTLPVCALVILIVAITQRKKSHE